MPDFLPNGSPLPDLPAMTQDEVLALFERLLPASYLEPLKVPGPGYEYLQAVAAMVARVSQAIAHVGSGGYILSATGGSYATATVALSRTSTEYGALSVLAGTLVGTPDGYLYATQADVPFGASDVGPYSVLVKAVTRGWMWNNEGPVIAASGDVIPGPIRRMVKPLVSGPNYFDPTLVVAQVTAATGGSAPMLDGLGLDRGMARQIGETDADYRRRLVLLPDTVTPAAMQRILKQLIGAFVDAAGKTYHFREDWDLRLMTAYDFPINETFTQAAPNFVVPAFSGNVFVYDSGASDPLANRYPPRRGAFVVALPAILGLEAVYAGLADLLAQAAPAGISIGYILTE